MLVKMPPLDYFQPDLDTPLSYLSLTNTNSAGLDLSKIANDDVSRDEVTARVRKHIGSGILVSLEEDGIWLYNRSEVRKKNSRLR